MIAVKNIPGKLHRLIENEKGSHFFLDEAFGIEHNELIKIDKALTDDVYFWIAYQHADIAPHQEQLAGKKCLLSFLNGIVGENVNQGSGLASELR